MKKFLVISFSVIFVFVVCSSFCFAASLENNSDISDYFSISVDEIVVNGSGDFILSGSNPYVFSYDDVSNIGDYLALIFYIHQDCTVSFSSDVLVMKVDDEIVSSLNFVSDDEVIVYFEFIDALDLYEYEDIGVLSVSTGSNSIFDFTSFIGIIGSFVTFVINSPVLLSLLLIGVTCSVVFVTVKIIRKVMWGN